MNRRALSAVAAFSLAVFFAGCAERSPLGPGSDPAINYQISDGPHAGDPNFIWLPPIASDWAVKTGPFDFSALNELAVEVCRVDASGACLGPVIDRFTSTSADTKLVNEDERYEFRWNANRDVIDFANYRLRVLRKGVEIGFADVAIVRQVPPDRPIDTSKYFLVIKGSTVQFNFRVQVPTARTNVKINEVESNQGVPGDWIELVNTAGVPLSLDGYVVRDNDNTHNYVFPAGTTIPANGYYVVEEAALGFGLGSADAARLFTPNAALLVDAFDWTAHAATTWGRCPNASGAFATTGLPTKGAANFCGGDVTALRLNEVESNGGTPDDWTEWLNTGAAPVDVSGFIFRDNDNSHAYVLPSGTIVAPGAYLLLESGTFGFGLGAPDQARLFAPNNVTILDSLSWTAHAVTTYGRCPNGTGGFVTTTSSTKGAANDCGVTVRINEVESDGGVPADWVELYNPGVVPVDLSGFVFRDNDNTDNYVIPSGTSIAAGGFLVLDQAAFGFGLGSSDQARLFAPGGVNLVDSYTWTAHATTTYGRCPDGTGAFTTTVAVTKGSANACPGSTASSPWPGDANIANADASNVFGGNMSGLVYEGSGSSAPGTLWAARNGPGTIHRLVFDGTLWGPDPAGWAAGKALRYPNGLGNPDAEGITMGAGGSASGLYVATERNNDNNAVSRNAILRFDPSTPGTELVAINEWDLTSDLPATGANLGAEAIAFLPDAFLTSRGFFDESKGHAYNPSEYPTHGGGIFFVALEANGVIYGYALNHNTDTFTRVATITSGFVSVMDLNFDPELHYLWAECDDGCQGRTAILEIGATGRFGVTHVFDRPAGMPNLNNEGFTVTPQAECVNGLKPVFWSDDAETGGHAIRTGKVTCSAFAPLQLMASTRHR